jgi:hypothetical protein
MATKTDKYTTPLTLDEAVKSIANWAYCDSHVVLDPVLLREKIQADVTATDGRLPSEKDCEEMVIGDDVGALDERLEEDFPSTCEFIASHW